MRPFSVAYVHPLSGLNSCRSSLSYLYIIESAFVITNKAKLSFYFSILFVFTAFLFMEVFSSSRPFPQEEGV